MLTRAAAPAPPRTIEEALHLLLRHPVRSVLGRWNWKAAVTSSIVRGSVFFLVNLSYGTDAALAAFVTEFLLRAGTSGFYGTVTQTFSSVEPQRAATVAVSLLLPILSHAIELVTHWLRGTEALALSLAASVLFTTFSTAFNLHAMRHNVLTVGEGSHSLLADLRLLPGLALSLVGLRWRWPSPRSVVNTEA